ncbi:MAG: hypothetical protein ABI759_08185 [Candidatus Solibacter sp.]
MERSNLFLREMLPRVQEIAVYRLLPIVLLAATFAVAADPTIPPLTVCEVLADLPAYEGKDVAVLGRFSFRRDGRWIGEQSCEAPRATDDARTNGAAANGAAKALPLLWLTEDGFNGPRPPDHFEFDVAVLNKKFAAMVKKTTLGKFRFGTPDYDRWAVVFGRVTARKGEAAQKAAGDLVFRGDGVIVFLTTDK